MIILRKLSKNYTTPKGSIPALHEINLHVQKGEIFGIIGKSGAGKSSLIRCVNLLEKPSAGSVIVDGQDLTQLKLSDLRKARHKIGMIFQHFNLLQSRTVFENIALPLELSGVSREERETIILPLLELTGLLEKRDAYPKALSGGQKQRVAIARALAFKPKVLLCDEATSALDPQTTQTILDLLKDIRDKMHLTILLITHEMDVIKACCDRVGILDQGHLIEENEIGEFFAYPKTDKAKEFISSSLPQRLPPTIEKHLRSHSEPNTHPVLRLWFRPDTATQPIVAKLITQFGLQINLLQGSVEYVKQHATGVMLLAIAGEPRQIEASLDYLSQIGIQTEIIGHVPNDIIPFA